jgi:hypothetical protein
MVRGVEKLIESRVCLEERRRADRRGGLTVHRLRRGAVVPMHPFVGQILAGWDGVMCWRGPRRCVILGFFCPFDKISPIPAHSLTPSWDAEWGFSPQGLFWPALAFLACETDLFGLSHHLRQTAECGR